MNIQAKDATLVRAMLDMGTAAQIKDILKIGGFPGQIEIIDKNTSGSTH